MRCHPGGRRLQRSALLSPRLRCCTVLASGWRPGFFPATDEPNQRPARGVPDHSTDQGSGVTVAAKVKLKAALRVTILNLERSIESAERVLKYTSKTGWRPLRVIMNDCP
jgi:hypothetical protein